MLINPRRRKTSRRRKYRRNEAFINPPATSKAIRAQIKALRKPTKKRKRGRMKVKTVARKLHVSPATVIKYEQHRKRKRKKGKKAKRHYTRKRLGGKKKAYLRRKNGVRRHKRHARRLGARSRTVYVPIKISKRRRGKKVYFTVNPGLKAVQPMAVNALWTALGFIGARLVGNLLKKVIPVSFLKSDLVVHAIVPVLLTVLKVNLPNKGALLSGAYLSWVLKALGLVLPENIKSMLGQGGTYYYDPSYSMALPAPGDPFNPNEPWYGYSGPQTLLPGGQFMSPAVDADGDMGAYRQTEDMGAYTQAGDGMGVFVPTDPRHSTPWYSGDGDSSFGAIPSGHEAPAFGAVDFDADGE